MANEWVKVELYGANNDGDVRRYDILDTIACSRGQLLALANPRMASTAVLATNMFAGVASEEKCANDGTTSISCWTNGIFDVHASSATAIGVAVTGNQLNQVEKTTNTGAECIGYILEAAEENQVVNVRLNL